jgi:CheY-like chemotaxis protein
MSARPKILLLDDEEDLLEMYREIFSQLPSHPEIYTSNSGARAISLLDAEPFSLLISDLNMPKMDGLQVLSIVRRKFPHLRIVVLTAVVDEHYRSRAYAMGVDLFWQKPGTDQEIELFKECIESLLGTDGQAPKGFRGVQSKSLVDIIQLECLSQSSSVLKITNGSREGRIWILDGNIIDATADALTGEAAFKEIFSWKTGNFETFPAEPDHPRTIEISYQSLLLDTAQTIDESHAVPEPVQGAAAPVVSQISALARFKGVEFVLAEPEKKGSREAWGLENPDPMAEWARELQRSFTEVGEKLRTGEVADIIAMGPQRHVAVCERSGALLCAGFHRNLQADQVRETFKSMTTKWAS